MKYIKTINFLLLIFLICSCKYKEKKVVIKNSSKKAEITKEVTNSILEKFIDKMVLEEHFKGSILTMVDNEIIHSKGYGMANDTTKNKVDTKFHVGSITKQFTAAAIMQLLEEGKINLNESINNFLPSKYRSDKWVNINIHNLLSHTSGIEDYAVTRDYYEVEKGFCLGNTVDNMIREAMSKDLEFNPGTQFSYSNIGYTLLGHIIEQQTGELYHNYMKNKIFTPLGMSSSFIHTPDYIPLADEAIGYRWDEEQNIHVHDDIISLPVTEPDGNLVTTLHDFLKLTDIYVDNKKLILQEQSIKQMTTAHSKDDELGPNNDSQMYGYGLSLTDKTICHSGYIVGFRSHFIVNPKENIRVFVFSNNVSNNPKKISSGIYKILSKPHE